MARARPLVESIHLTALGLWLGAVVMSGVAAATIFPTVRKLNPQLPDYAGYTGEHWLIVAGQIANRIFVIADAVQLACATLCIITLALLLFRHRIPMNRASAVARVTALGIAVCLVGFYAIYLRTRMDLNVRGYWEAALVGNNEEAARFKDVFLADHPLASNLLKAIALSVLLSLAAGAWNAATSGTAPPPAKPRPKPSQYEEPALLRSRR